MFSEEISAARFMELDARERLLKKKVEKRTTFGPHLITILFGTLLLTVTFAQRSLHTEEASVAGKKSLKVPLLQGTDESSDSPINNAAASSSSADLRHEKNILGPPRPNLDVPYKGQKSENFAFFKDGEMRSGFWSTCDEAGNCGLGVGVYKDVNPTPTQFGGEILLIQNANTGKEKLKWFKTSDIWTLKYIEKDPYYYVRASDRHEYIIPARGIMYLLSLLNLDSNPRWAQILNPIMPDGALLQEALNKSDGEIAQLRLKGIIKL